MSVKSISIEEAVRICKQVPTLVIGPAATYHINWSTTLAREVIQTVPQISAPSSDVDIQTLIDLIKQQFPERLYDAISYCKNRISEMQATRLVQELAAGQWSSVVSLSPDMTFESEYEQNLVNAATQWTHTVISHHSIGCPQHSTPIFKLLGNLVDNRDEHTLALGTSSYLRRRQNWPSLLRPIMDYARDAPFVFVGTETSITQVRDLISALLSGPPPHPASLMCFSNDGTFEDPTLLALIDDRCDILNVQCTARAFSEKTSSISQHTSFMPSAVQYVDPGIAPAQQEFLSAFKEFIDPVPTKAPANTDFQSLRKPLCDSLFRSVSHDWLPFLFEMPLKRTLCDDVEETVLSKVQYLSHDSQPVITLVGDASVGKTVIMKQLAVRLARRGLFTCWIRKSPSEGIRKSFRSFCQALIKTKAVEIGVNRPLLLLCDDPIYFNYSVSALVDIATEYKLPTIFLVALRSSDVLSKEELMSPLYSERTTIPPLLDTDEMEAIPEFLCRTGIATSITEATAIANGAKRDARDVLCSFWYLVPETRHAIAVSLQDEYCRLGGVTGAVKKHAAAAISQFGDHARQAYECVAVASRLDVGVPLEVLVRAVEMNIEEWRSMCVDGKPVWGLLYDEQASPTSDIFFRTRNHIVTDVLLDLVNAGTGHAGEFRILKRLVGACYIGTPQYRSFLISILVSRRQRLEEMLTYEQGVDLFHLALNIFPEPDKTLQHHYGRWHKKWKRYQEADAQYAKALDTPSYPYVEQEEKDEHIHTSSAANVVARFVAGEFNREAAFDKLKDHLRQASRPSHFDAHTQHVFANMLIKIANSTEDSGRDALSLQSFADALGVIEFALQALGAQGAARRANHSHVEALLNLRATAFSTLTNFSEAAADAIKVYDNSGSQSGFEVLARKLLYDARYVKAAGTAFKTCWDYIESAEKHITSAGYYISDGLLAVKVDLMIRWRLSRPRGPIDWASLRDWLSALIQTSRFREDILKHFYLAVAHYHCEAFPLATSEFNWIRRNHPNTSMKRGIRNYLLGAEGFPRRLQGEVQEHQGRYYFFIPELSTSIPLDGPPAHLNAGATAHGYLGFELLGPKVVFDRPEEESCVLP